MCQRTSLVVRILTISILLIFPSAWMRAQLPAFPGADGAGANVTGGRGGIVYHVTKLDRNFSDTEVGTLRYGLNDANFPAGTRRTIVFDVGGTFWLGRYGAEKGHNNGWDTQDRLDIGNNVTIAGQTAPGFVCIMGGVIKPGKTNIIVRNVLVAPGYGMRSFEKPEDGILPTPGDFPDSYVYDAFDISGQNVMIDHCTTIYATDETISANEFASNVTFQYCNIAQGQNYPQADAENPGVYTGHALGSLLQAGSNCKISVLHNLYAHLKGRLPRVGSEVGTGPLNDFRNNVFYNWFNTAGTGANGQPSFNNFINNFYLAGNGGDNVSGTNIITSGGGTSIFNGASPSVTRAYVAGNLKDINKDGDPNDGISADGSYSSTWLQPSAYNVNIGVTLNATDAFENVLRYVGSRWWERDYDIALNNTNAINTPDERLIHETATGTGKIMAWADDPFNDDPNEGVEWRTLLSYRADTNTFAAPFNRPPGWDTDGDGMPDYWEIEHGLDPNVPNNNGDFDNDGYTDLEEYLNEIAAWPAPGDIIFTGATNSRYALIYNWRVYGQPVNISGKGTVTTWSLWQPSRYDTAIISNATAVVDAVGQHAGTLRLRDNGELDLNNGWLKVSNTLEIATSGSATLNLSGGRLYVGTLAMGGGFGSFNFTGGTLSADVVTFDLLDQGGAIAPCNSPGQTHVMGNLTLQAGSSLDFELGTTNTGASDTIVVDGNLNLGGTLNVTNLAGFGPGTYTLITYAGSLNGLLAVGTTPPDYSYTVDTGIPGQVNLVVAPPPAFQSIKLDNGDVVISGTGPTHRTLYLLESTDLTLPLNLWTPVATNAFDGTGYFSITNPIDVGGPKIFYQLLLP